MDSDHDVAGSAAIALRVREELGRRRLSRQALADAARLSVSTLEKALAGRRPFTLATVIRLEEALGVSLRAGPASALPAAPRAEFAATDLGGYARQAVGRLEGDYLTLRPSFGEPGAVYAYRTLIAWDADKSHLTFSESDRLDSEFSQRGSVSLPHQSGHIYLLTSELGQHRLITLGRPTISGELYGSISTLLVGQGTQLAPVCAPIVLIPLKSRRDVAFGKIPPQHPSYADYRRQVDRVVAEGFARFLSQPIAAG